MSNFDQALSDEDVFDFPLQGKLERIQAEQALQRLLDRYNQLPENDPIAIEFRKAWPWVAIRKDQPNKQVQS